MKSEYRGLVLVVAVILVSAVLGAVYGPNVRATTSSAEDEHTAIRQFTNVLDVVQANYAEPVDDEFDEDEELDEEEPEPELEEDEQPSKKAPPRRRRN